MSSSIAAIAYALNDCNSLESLKIRINAVERHLSPIYRVPLTRRWVGDGRSGLVYWESTEKEIDWEFFAERPGDAILWGYVPGVAGGPESGVDSFELGRRLSDDEISAESIGCPFFLLRWRAGIIDVINDVYGLARLFHFRFKDGEVWTTRPGVAHVFMAERATRSMNAWSGMATLGFPTRGYTHLGRGQQVRAASHLRISADEPGRVDTQVIRDLQGWFGSARSADFPDAISMASSMGEYSDVARRWPSPATADLSGGKDSRAIVAVGIASGAITRVRTIDTDPEEARVARKLMSLVEAPVEHIIEGRGATTPRENDFMNDLVTQHRAWEGRYMASTAFNGGKFAGFKVTRSPRFNGLGGETSNGGILSGGWTDRLRGKSLGAGVDRMHARVKGMPGVSADARERASSILDDWTVEAEGLGLQTAFDALDLIYAFDTMSNWSATYGSPHRLTPFYSAKLIPLGISA